MNHSHRHGLPPKALEAILQVLAAHPQVEQAILYGSRAMGNFEAASDIDLTLTGAGLTPACLAQIEADLDDLLLPWMIDLSAWASINHPPLLDHIQRLGVVLFERNPQQGYTSQGAEVDAGSHHS